LGTIVVPACFWGVAAKRNWPPLVPASFLLRRPYLSALAGRGFALGFLVAVFLWSMELPFWSPIGDCFGVPMVDTHGAPRGIDFTARILWIGPGTYQGWSLWAIARVEERFPGQPWQPPRFVIVCDFFKPGVTSRLYFVEGGRASGLLSRFPRSSCGGTADTPGPRRMRNQPSGFCARDCPRSVCA